MASTKQLEDTLPLCDSHHNRAGDTLSGQRPIYFLVTFDERGLEELESDINGAEDSTLSPAWRPRDCIIAWPKFPMVPS